jgi:hypothetical protein
MSELSAKEQYIKDRYTFVKVPSTTNTADIKVGLNVGVQTFHIDFNPENLEHALWMQTMLVRALTNLVDFESKT